MTTATHRTIQIAEALAEELAAIGWPVKVEFLPSYSREELEELHVPIVIKSEETTIEARSLDRDEHTIDIGILRQVDPNDIDDMKGMLLHVSRLKNLFKPADEIDPERGLLRSKDFAGATWIKTKNEPIYNVEHLSELRQFTSVVSLTFLDLE